MTRTGRLEMSSTDLLEAELMKTDETEEKIRQVRERLTIVAGKKKQFRSSVSQLDVRVAQLESRCQQYERETEHTAEELADAKARSRACVEELRDMRGSYTNEIKVLQRGLTRKPALGDGFASRVDELAELMDFLGRAVVMRDRATVAKKKLEAQARQIKDENRDLQALRARRAREIAQAQRKVRAAAAENAGLTQDPECERMEACEDDEFERALCDFERKFLVLDDGAGGLYETLNRLKLENASLEARSAEAVERIDIARRQREDWKRVAEEKAVRRKAAEELLAQVREDHEKMNAKIKQRSDEIEAQVMQERELLEEEREAMERERAAVEARLGMTPEVEDDPFRSVRVTTATSDPFPPPRSGMDPQLQSSPEGSEEVWTTGHAGTAQSDPFPPPPHALDSAASLAASGDEHFPPKPVGSRDSDDAGPPFPVKPLVTGFQTESAPAAPMDTRGSDPFPPAPDGAAGATAETEGTSADPFPQPTSAQTDDSAFIAKPMVSQESEESMPKAAPGTAETEDDPHTTKPMADVGPRTPEPTNEPVADEIVVEEKSVYAKTGELLTLKVCRVGESLVMRAREISTDERYSVEIPPDFLEEMDQEDPFGELFSIVGMAASPKALVLPTLRWRADIAMAPAGLQVALSVFQYDVQRFFIVALEEEEEPRIAELVLTEDKFDETQIAELSAIPDEPPAPLDRSEMIFNFLRSYLSLYEDEGENKLTLKFSH